MKKKVLMLLMASLASSVLLIGCGESANDEDTHTRQTHQREEDDDLLTKDDIDIDELKENEGEMLVVTNHNYGEVNSQEDYWSNTVYRVYYDGSIIVEKNYNLSGSSYFAAEISDKDYAKLYVFAYNAANNGTLDDISVEASDGEGWTFEFTKTNGKTVTLYSGYTYDVKELEKVQEILTGYTVEADFAQLEDGRGNGYEYEYVPEPGTWQEAYCGYLNEVLADRVSVYGEVELWGADDEYPFGYYLYDLTADGIPELIIKRGSCEADYNDNVYTYTEDGNVEYIGLIYSGHSSFYSGAKGELVQAMGHMGYAAISIYTYDNGEISEEMIFEESGYTDDGEWIEDFEYTPVGDIVEGAKYLGYNSLDNMLPFAMYDGDLPEYGYSDLVANKDDAEDFYQNVLDHNESVYAVGDGYMNDVGYISFDDLLVDGVMYNYTDGDVTITDTLVADVDGNGSYEMVLYFDNEDGYGHIGILSQEDDVIYCYLAYSSYSTKLTDDGYMLAYDEYRRKPIFYKDAIIWEEDYN